MAATKVTTKVIADDAVTIDKINDSALVTESEGISSIDNDTTVPTSAAVKDYVDTEVAGLVDAAPATLDTLNELAAALGDDANFSTTVTNSIATKQDAATAVTTTTNFGGDVSGTYNAIVIADDSHNHTIANVDGLQTALDGKLGLSSISATDSGGDGSFSYNNTTGVFTYTGPSATDVRAHFSGGTGVTITDGSIAIGQSVGTGDGVTFASVAGGTITGTSVSVTGDVVAYAS